MSNKQQTAVEWIINEIDMQYPLINIRHKQWLIDKAKELEKQQMESIWLDSRIEDKGDNYIAKQKTFIQYFNEKYGE